MAQVLVVGAGVTGCTVAYTLAELGIDVTLLEKADRIGGKVRKYGCKAAPRCQNCGVCLTTGLWDKVEKHEKIHVTGTVPVTTCQENRPPDNSDTFDAIVICTGFDNQTLPDRFSSHLHITNTTGIITGTQLEELMLGRTGTGLFENSDILTKAPNSIAFIQCVGSRDLNESGLYCSRVCCSYSTRAAKVIRSYYSDCEIVFFYMELQNVESGDYYKGLSELGVKFIECRPLKLTGGESVTVEYDDGQESGIKSKEFDLVVLSDGIYAGKENDLLAELYGLDIDKDGFLLPVGSDIGNKPAVYVAGCARVPMKIDEAYADAITVAGKVLSQVNKA